MIKINWSKLKTDALSTVRAFPIEIVLSISLFIIIVIARESNLNIFLQSQILLLPLFWTASFSLNRLFTTPHLRWIYYSGLLLLPLAFFIELPEPPELSYFISWVIAIAVVIASGKEKDNRRFTISTLRIPYHMALSYILNITLAALLAGIYASIIYIFDFSLGYEYDIYFYLFSFPMTVVAPFLFCLFQHREQDNYNWQASRFFEILNNWIVSPAVVAYTCLLYIYGIKILFTWNMPKGLLSYMIAIFLFIAVIARACQSLLKKEYYGWFYNRFHRIVIPILVLFWIGVLIRIFAYGFTEDRVYLFVFCILISTVSLLSFQTPKSNYLYFTCFVAGALAIITFIPGITANDLGVLSQKKRLNNYIQKLDLKDTETGLIRERAASEALQDSSFLLSYKEMTNVYQHLIEKTSPEYMKERYGYAAVDTLTRSVFGKNIPASLQKEKWYEASLFFYRTGEKKIDIAEYTTLYDQSFHPNVIGDSIFIETDSATITAFDLSNFIADRPALLLRENQSLDMDSLLYLKNDSCMALINHLDIKDKKVLSVSINMLFTK